MQTKRPANSTAWQYGLSSLFAVTLAVAAFCAGWVVNDQHRQQTGDRSEVNDQRVLELLSKEQKTRAAKIDGLRAKANRLGTSDDDAIDSKFTLAELQREQAVAAAIAQRRNVIATRSSTSTIPRSVVTLAILAAGAIGCFLAGLIYGHRNQTRSLARSRTGEPSDLTEDRWMNSSNGCSNPGPR